MAVKWGILGLGNIAARMATAIGGAENATLVAACSRDAGKAAEFARWHGAARSYSTYEEMLLDPSVAAVYLSTPNALHASQTISALEAGKHVLVEKPMALTVEDAERMVETARRKGLALGVGFHLRHHPVHVEIRRLLESGELGEVIAANAIWGYYSPNFPRDRWQMNPEMAGAGSIMGIGVHLIDLLHWLIGRKVTQVTAFTDGPSEQYPVEFVTSALLRFEGAALAGFTSSRRLPNSSNSIAVYCNRGRVEGQSTLGMDPAGQLCLVRGNETTIRQLPLRDLYTQEVEAFCRAIDQGTEFHASGEDGVRSVALTVAILDSARTCRAVRFD